MTTKQYLGQIRLLDLKIKQLQERKKDIEWSLLPGGIDYSKDKVQTSPSDSMSEMVARMAELANEIENQISRMIILKSQITNEIHTLNDARYVQLLYLRYVECKRFEEISCDMGYDYNWIRHMHDKALKAFEKKKTQKDTSRCDNMLVGKD